MGCVRSEQIKRLARELIEKYPNKFSADYEANKRALAEIAIIPSNKIRNQIAGYISHLRKIEQKQVQKQVAVITAPPMAA
ncbi:30S ribosomal protein S17e [Candidatus Bathyarchaeota archaeon]|nr:30S ribosomal protein S17e [Candidatus Bathyarchaeota archaeon]